MLTILEQYIEGENQITVYTRDGITPSHTVTEPIYKPIELIPEPDVPTYLTLEDRVKALEDVANILLGLEGDV